MWMESLPSSVTRVYASFKITWASASVRSDGRAGKDRRRLSWCGSNPRSTQFIRGVRRLARFYAYLFECSKRRANLILWNNTGIETRGVRPKVALIGIRCCLAFVLCTNLNGPPRPLRLSPRCIFFRVLMAHLLTEG